MRVRVNNPAGTAVIALVQPVTGTASSGGSIGSASCPAVAPTCSHSIELTDTYGDGWNGGSVSVLVNGVTVLTNITLGSGSGPAIFSFNASTGASITVQTVSGGSYFGEMRYTVKNGSGVALVTNHNPSASGNWSGTGSCPAPCTPPAVVGFGINTWNVLGYQHAGYNYGNIGSLAGHTFRGYYSDATVDINSELRWGSTLSPSSAAPYTGCPVTVDNHTVVYKRQGFPSAFYQIDLNTHDDGVQCYVNGALVYQIDGCCADRGVIWSGRLCSTSTVEFRVMEGGGGSNLNVDFIDIPFTAGTISGSSSICPGGSSNLTTTGNPGGTWTSSNGSIAAVNASGVVSAVNSGNATITYTVNGGACGNATATYAVTVVAGASAGVLSGTQTVCSGSTTTFTSNGNAGGTWSSSNAGVASVNASSGVISGVAAGTATISYTVTGSGGCPNATATRTVTVNASPTANAGSDATLCPGQTASLGVAPGSLSTSPVSSSAFGNDNTNFTTAVTISGAVSGATITSLTFTPSLDYYGNACSYYNSWYVMQYWNGASWVNLPCGSSVTINDFNGTVANGLVFTIRVIDLDAYADAVTISINNLVVNYSNPTTYSWSPATNLSSSSVSNPTCSATTTTTYTLTASANGCSSTDQVVVTVLPGASAGLLSGAQTACVGATTTFTSNGTAGGTWTSDNAGVASVNASTGVITGVAAGTATITYTVLGSGGCPNATATRSVTVNAAPVADAGPDQTICIGQTAVLGIASVTATTPVSSSAFGNDNTNFTTAVTVSGAASGATITSLTFTPSLDYYGNTCYYYNNWYVMQYWNGSSWVNLPCGSSVTINDFNGTVANGLVFTIRIIDLDAVGDAATISINNLVVNYTNPTTYSWSPATNLSSSTVSNPTCSAVATTIYTLTASAGGCSSTDAVIVTVSPLPTVLSLTGSAVCSGLGTITSSTSQSGVNYQLYNSSNTAEGSVLAGTGSGLTWSGIAAGTGYYVIGTNATTSCTSTASNGVAITINAAPTVTANVTSTPICLGTTVTLTGGGATTYTWDNGVTDGVAFAPTATTTYTVTGTTAGCSNTASVLVTVNTPTTTASVTAGTAVWRGATSVDFGTATNWYAYDGTNYSVSATPPSTSTNVIIPVNQGCVSLQPSTLANSGSVNNITIEAGATLTMQNGTLVVQGNWENNGTFVSGTGTVQFSGTGNATVGGSASNNFNNVTMNKTGEALLISPATIAGSLTLTNGNLNIAGYTLDMASQAINGGSATSYVKTSGGGVLKRDVSGLPVIFPVGKSSYNPATLTNTGAGDNFSVRVYDYVSTTGVEGGAQTSGQVVNRTWMVSEALVGGSSVKLKMQWNTGEEANGFVYNPGFMNVNHHNGSIWEELGAMNQSNSPFFVEQSGISSFSPFTIGITGSPLPIELISFQANCAGNKQVAVTWSTASEHNTSHFVVEKSRDGVNWTTFNTLGAAGNSTTVIDYALTDTDVANGTTYYRLTQFDTDGASETFNIASVNCGEQAATSNLVTYPNPSNGSFYLDFYTQDLTGPSLISVFDSRGVIIYRQDVLVEKGSNVFQIEKMDAAPGMYYIQVSNGTTTSYIVKHSLR
jgi:uncharacterized protein YjdB